MKLSKSSFFILAICIASVGYILCPLANASSESQSFDTEAFIFSVLGDTPNGSLDCLAECNSKERQQKRIPYNDRVSLEDFSSDYPWIVDYYLRPNYKGLAKWNGDIKISIDFPNNLKPASIDQTKKVFFFKGEQSNIPNEEITVLEEILKNAISEVSEAANQNFPFEINLNPSSLDETRAEKGNLRIIFADAEGPEHFKWQTRGTSSLGYPKEVFFKEWATGRTPIVEFTPKLRSQVYGYFLVNKEHTIDFAACYLPRYADHVLLKNLISECLMRSLGVPYTFQGEGASIFSNWNQEGSHNNHVKISSTDKKIIKLLYSDKLKRGDNEFDVKSALLSEE